MPTRCSLLAVAVALSLLLLPSSSLAARKATATVSLKESCDKTPYPKECMKALSVVPGVDKADARGLAEMAIRTSAKLGASVGDYVRTELDVVKESVLWEALSDCKTNLEDVLDHLDDSEGEDVMDQSKFEKVHKYFDSAEHDMWSCDESFRKAPTSDVKTRVLQMDDEFEKMMQVTYALIKLEAGDSAPAPAPPSP